MAALNRHRHAAVRGRPATRREGARHQRDQQRRAGHGREQRNPGRRTRRARCRRSAPQSKSRSSGTASTAASRQLTRMPGSVMYVVPAPDSRTYLFSAMGGGTDDAAGAGAGPAMYTINEDGTRLTRLNTTVADAAGGGGRGRGGRGGFGGGSEPQWTPRRPRHLLPARRRHLHAGRQRRSRNGHRRVGSHRRTRWPRRSRRRRRRRRPLQPTPHRPERLRAASPSP